MGPGLLRQFPRRAARHRHLPSGQSRISRPDRLDAEGEIRAGRGKETTVEVAYPDSLVGTDSHTTMVNGLSVLGWGVGGIEAEACMLGQPLSMLLPEVIGFKLTGELKEGVTATDLVLTVTQMLRKKGVVGKFVEFYGPGLDASLARRPRDHRQYGAGIWRDLRLLPGRRETLNYLHDLGAHAGPRRARRGICQGAGPVPHHGDAGSGLHRHARSRSCRPSCRRWPGPKRPEGRVALGSVGAGFKTALDEGIQEGRRCRQALPRRRQEFRSRPWRRGDRGDHLLHQHLEPERADRRRACSPATPSPRA